MAADREESLKAYKKRLDSALDNQFLRKAMDNFAVAYRASRENAFAGMDTEGLIQAVADAKADAVIRNRELMAAFKKRLKKTASMSILQTRLRRPIKSSHRLPKILVVGTL